MNNLTLYNEVQACLKRGEQVVMATVVKTAGAAPCGIGSKMLVYANGTTLGSLAGPLTDARVAETARQARRDGHSRLDHIHLDADRGEAVGSCGATLEIFFEVMRPEPRLIIAGAGYVAQALVRLATYLDLRAIVIDERRELVDPTLFGEQAQLTFGDIARTLRELEPDEHSFVVVVTRGHRLDEDVLKAALETRAGYVGMIGSQGKVKNIFKSLFQQGISRQRLAEVHAPIGLDLGAETPDEIALSIAAEIMMLRRQASGAPLHTRHNLLDELPV